MLGFFFLILTWKFYEKMLFSYLNVEEGFYDFSGEFFLKGCYLIIHSVSYVKFLVLKF